MPFWHRMPLNPIAAFSDEFRVTAMDQRNAGQSRGPLDPRDCPASKRIMRCGTSEALGPVMLAYMLARWDHQFLAGQNVGMQGGNALSEATSQLVDGEVRRILDTCYDDAERPLREHRRPIEALTGTLLDRETLDEQENVRAPGVPRSAIGHAVDSRRP